MRFTTQKRPVIYHDKLLFEPEGEHEYHATIQIKEGKIEVWTGMLETTDSQRPYEVWYPGAQYPTPHQTWQDIMSYIINR